MLQEYAGGLQQSFSTVFDRVGQSLAQSAQMMQMMNDVMEAALLQNLRLEHQYDPTSRELIATLENRSQILLGEVTLSVRLDTVDPEPRSPLFTHTFASWSPGEQHTVRVPVQMVQVAGHIELAFQSPGTQALLQKSCPFRISLFQTARFQTVKRDDVAINPLSSSISANIALQKLRDVLRLSPLDAMITVDTGSYRFVNEQSGTSTGNSFFLSISSGPGESGAEVMIAAEQNGEVDQDSDALRLRCEELLRDLEESTK